MLILMFTLLLSYVHANVQCDATKMFYLSQSCCSGENTQAMCHAPDFDSDTLLSVLPPSGLKGRMFVPTENNLAFYFVSEDVFVRRSPLPDKTVPRTKSAWLDNNHARDDFLYPFDKHARYNDHHVLWSQMRPLVTLHSDVSISHIGWGLTSVGSNSLTVHKDTMSGQLLGTNSSFVFNNGVDFTFGEVV